jgi:UDP-N-acetylmuramate--alanine ligase
MQLEQVKNVYFIGIGGIGMSALARWFHANKYLVAGYDKTSTDLTEALVKEGIHVTFEDSLNTIPETFKNPLSTLVVYTPAIPKDHKQWNWYKDQTNYQFVKRSQILGFLTQSLSTIGIAGTHGKTTTSSMTATLFQSASKSFSAFLGGITKNFNSNLIIGDHTDNKNWVVVEADEYDRSFLQLSPTIAVVNNMDPDHLDIYENSAAFNESFQLYINKTKQDGIVLLHESVELNKPEQVKAMYTYGIGDKAYFKINNLVHENGGVVYSIVSELGKWDFIRINVPGMHNVYNATAAFLSGYFAGLTIDELKKGLESYLGVNRRFDIHFQNETKVYVDDYAHHPTEISALINAVETNFPNKKKTIVFQPHLFTRTRDFMDDFASALSKADEVILLDIYPARELPIEGIDSKKLLSKISNPNKKIWSKEEVLIKLSTIESEILITAGAGDIDRLIIPIKNHYKECYGKG